VHFLVLEQNGGRTVQAGDVPAGLTLDSVQGGRFVEGGYVLWRRVHLLEREDDRLAPHPSRTDGGSTDPLLGDGGQIMAIGVEGSPDRPGIAKETLGIAFTLLALLLFVAASSVAWIVAVRGRLLGAQLETERVRRAHLEEMALAAAGLAHETKNPLGIIRGIAQQIAGDPKEQEWSRDLLEQVVDEVGKATARLGSFMTFARKPDISMTPMDARAIIDGVARVLRQDFATADVKLEVRCAPRTILGDEEMLQQILVNLLLNSLRASHPGTTVTVALEQRGRTARMTVEDQGSGIVPDLLTDVFKPYVTGHPEGHGLGLAIVKRFVVELGWTSDIDSRPERGTTVTISGMRPGEIRDSEA